MNLQRSVTRAGWLALLAGFFSFDAPAQITSGLSGFAAVKALGLEGTSGGAGGVLVTATNASQFLNAIVLTGAVTIRVQGLISLPAGMHAVASHKTIVGLERSGLTGAGLILSGVSNVILQNLIFTNASDDAISIESYSHHVWVDHCDLSAAHDGLLDIKRGADFVTVSWNHFHHQDKTMLLGHSDANERQDAGRLRVTYHHNWFDGTVQRNPRVRFGEPVHVFNNYYYAMGNYAVAAQRNSGVLVEGNYFETVKKPVRNDITKDPVPGRFVERNNVFVDSVPSSSCGTVVEPSTFYRYRLDPPAEVKAIVTSGAGLFRARKPGG